MHYIVLVSKKGLNKVLCLLVIALLFAASLSSHAETESTEPAWTQPGAMAVRLVSSTSSMRDQAVFDPNLDCNLLTYRQVGYTTMETGCFTPTAYGMVDLDNSRVIFNGTDEAVQLVPFTASQLVVPWPDSDSALALTNQAADGMLATLYKGIYAHLDDQYDAGLRLSGKKLNIPPDLTLKDSAGQPYVFNPQTLAFSDGGSWLVAETLSGYFVRINLATLDALPFAPSYAAFGTPGMLASQVSISEDGRYVAIHNNTASSLKVYDLEHCSLDGSHPGYKTCSFYDYRPFVDKQVPGLSYISKLRFMNRGTLLFNATLQDHSAKTYLLAPRTQITSLIDYLALGDSFTSGEGTFDYLNGTDTAENMCHQSSKSYPYLITRQLYSSTGGHSVACSGAVIDDIASKSSNYHGQVKDGKSLQELQQTASAQLADIEASFLPGYVSQHRFVKQTQPGVLTVSVSGDDAGFGDILQLCVAPHLAPHSSDSCFETYEDRLELLGQIDAITPKLTALLKQLRSESPGTQVYAIGYPQIAYDNGSCGLNVHLNKSEVAFSNELVDYLNGAVALAARDAGVTYVNVSDALAGHRLCEATSAGVAMNGLTAGTDGGILGIPMFGKESYHPNALGQELLAQAILAKTHNLSLTPTGASIAHTPSTSFLDKPKTGRAVTKRVPTKSAVTSLTRSTRTVKIKTSGKKSGAKPKSTYTIKLNGAGGAQISSGITDNEGDIDTSVSIPPGQNGGLSIDIIVPNPAGEPIDITQPIYIPVSDTDADGDRIPDPQDSCPTVQNSGVDADYDGVDDTCDPSYSQAGGQGNNSDTNVVQPTNSPVYSPPSTPSVPASPVISTDPTVEGSLPQVTVSPQTSSDPNIVNPYSMVVLGASTTKTIELSSRSISVTKLPARKSRPTARLVPRVTERTIARSAQVKIIPGKLLFMPLILLITAVIIYLLRRFGENKKAPVRVGA